MLSEMREMRFKNSHLNMPIGSLLSWERINEGIKGIASSGVQFKVCVYTHHVIKIHITRDENFNEHSYAVVQRPSAVDFLLEESAEKLTIITNAVHLNIHKSTINFSFFTLAGKSILEDDAHFSTSWLGEQVTSYKKLQEGERFIGLGEKTGPLDRRGHGYQNWNTDHFGYPPDSDPLYCSTPFYIGIHSKLAYGVFLDNSHKTHFNFGASNRRFSSFSADLGDMSYYFIHHENVKDIISSYTYLTGTMQIPPKWSLGYQQCRYSYRPDKEVLSIANTFREKDIPADVIVLDIHYMKKFKIFTWDNIDFPNPSGLIRHLEEKGFKVVVIFDPGIKIENGYSAYESGVENDVFVKYPDGENYEAEVWPGWCHFPDFTSTKAREWWQQQMQYYTNIGIEGFWNDMNEIATWGQSLPELIEFDFEGQKTSTREARNVYGMQMAKSTYEGAKQNLKGKRVFNLTRAGYSGVQRYAAVWTGDNVADDEHMLLGVRLVNSLGLAGIAFAGYDIGGFAGNADENLFARWVSIGAFSPFFRGHSMLNSKDSEPWSYGEKVEEISRNYIKLRYKLMPYIYAAFHEASTLGTPVARSLAIDYTHDGLIYDEDYYNEYLFGLNILVAPVASSVSLAKVYLPEGDWYDLFTDVRYSGQNEIVAECPIERLPVYVKASAIIPMQDSIASLSSNNNQILQLHIYNGIEDSSYAYYEDDGSTFDYEKSAFYKREIRLSPLKGELEIAYKVGNYHSQYKSIQLYLHGFSDVPSTIKVNDKDVSVNCEDFEHIAPISDFDPFIDLKKTSLKIKNLPYIVFDNEDDTIKINW